MINFKNTIRRQTCFYWVGVACFVLTCQANGALTNLVSSGDFESPVNTGNVNQRGAGALGSQWTFSAGNSFELWRQGILGSPSLGSDGIATGQHLEVRGTSGTSTTNVTLSLTIPNQVVAGSSATLNFDAWNRGSNQSTGRYQILVGGSDLGTFTANTAAGIWTANTQSFAVSAGDTVSVIFTDSSGNSGGVGLHLDDVQLIANIIPEPGMMAVMLMGAMWFFTAWRRSRMSTATVRC